MSSSLLHRLTLTTLLALVGVVAAGCFDSHADGADGGGRDGGTEVWTDCWAALTYGNSGDACDFLGSCDDAMDPCGPGGTFAMCNGGVLTLGSRFCTVPLWETCGDYLSGFGAPGHACAEGGFVDCVRPDPTGCCGTVIRCEAGLATEEHLCPETCPASFCDSYMPPPPEAPLCRSQHDCSSDESCLPPGSPRSCGICMTAEHYCVSDADCDVGAICLPVPHPCDCDGPSTYCMPACAADADCEAGERCDTSTGRCEAVSCHAGYACPENTRCAPPGSTGVDAHSCARIPCTLDADCDCGACIDGLCYEGPGTCELPVP